MGEFLVITTSLLTASEMLKILGDPELLYWEESPYHLDVLAKWLPTKGFKILPKFFDSNYRPGTIGDDGDILINKIHGCALRSQDGGKPIPIWNSQVLMLQEMKEELRRVIEGNILDMSFEEEVVKEMEKCHGIGKTYYTADDENLRSNNENLKTLGEILLKLTECIDKVKKERDGVPPFFEFYIPQL